MPRWSTPARARWRLTPWEKWPSPTRTAVSPAFAFHALVRPEDVRLVDENEARQGLNVFDMAVEGSVHYGDSVLVIGRIGELPLRIRVPGAQAAAVARPGQLRVGWRPEDVHLIPRE